MGSAGGRRSIFSVSSLVPGRSVVHCGARPLAVFGVGHSVGKLVGRNKDNDQEFNNRLLQQPLSSQEPPSGGGDLAAP